MKSHEPHAEMTTESSADEAWLPIVGWEGLYEVSDQGRVRTVGHWLRASRGGGMRFWSGRLRKVSVNAHGYCAVTLYHRPKSNVSQAVHRAVLEAFRGPCPDGMEARHLNGHSQDNRLVNLAWGTKSENNLDRVRHGTHHHAAKTHCGRGHKFAGPNLVGKPNGRRCRACARSHATVALARRTGRHVPDFQALADRHYQQIMEETA